MKKNIKLLLLFLLFISGIYIVNAAQEVINLNPHETKYILGYKVTNNTDKEIFAPLSDISGKILNNYKGNDDTNILNFKSFGFSFGSNEKINTPLSIGGFTIEDASFTKSYGSWSTCSRTCGGGTQYRTVTCDREDSMFSLSSLCGLTSNIETQSCNTQACPPSPTWHNVSWGTALSGYRAGGNAYAWATVKTNCKVVWYLNGATHMSAGQSAWSRAYDYYSGVIHAQCYY